MAILHVRTATPFKLPFPIHSVLRIDVSWDCRSSFPDTCVATEKESMHIGISERTRNYIGVDYFFLTCAIELEHRACIGSIGSLKHVILQLRWFLLSETWAYRVFWMKMRATVIPIRSRASKVTKQTGLWEHSRCMIMTGDFARRLFLSPNFTCQWVPSLARDDSESLLY